MKANKLLATGLLMLSVASIALPSIAGEGDSRHHDGKWAKHEGIDGREFRHVGKALALTDAQKETLKTQREADKATREALQTKLADARSALVTAVDAGANDTELNALADTLGKLHAEQALAGAKAKKAFLAVLTEEQKQTLAEVKTKRLERKSDRKEARELEKS